MAIYNPKDDDLLDTPAERRDYLNKTMATQLISIDLDGEASTIRRKRGCGLDLRDIGGDFDVRRVSEVAWQNDWKGFSIFFIDKDEDSYARPNPLTVVKLNEVGMSFAGICKILQNAGKVYSYDGILSFEDYEDAVRIEVIYLEAAKLAGIDNLW